MEKAVALFTKAWVAFAGRWRQVAGVQSRTKNHVLGGVQRMWQCNSCICGVGLWRPRNCRTACGHSAQGMVWITLLECNAPLRTPVLVGDHGCVLAHVGTLCTSVHLLEPLVPKNQSPQSHRGRRPTLASLGAHRLFIAIVPSPIATHTLVQFRASPNLFQLEIGLVARIGGLWHQSDWRSTSSTVVVGGTKIQEMESCTERGNALLAMQISHLFVCIVSAACGIRWSRVHSTLVPARGQDDHLWQANTHGRSVSHGPT